MRWWKGRYSRQIEVPASGSVCWSCPVRACEGLSQLTNPEAEPCQLTMKWAFCFQHTQVLLPPSHHPWWRLSLSRCWRLWADKFHSYTCTCWLERRSHLCQSYQTTRPLYSLAFQPRSSQPQSCKDSHLGLQWSLGRRPVVQSSELYHEWHQ